MSIDAKYANTSITFKKADRWMIAPIKAIAEKNKWPIAFTLARLVEGGLEAMGIKNEEKA